MTYSDLMKVVVDDTDYNRRVEYALFVSAVLVMSESKITNSHAERAIFATRVLSGQTSIRAAVLTSLTTPSLANVATTVEITDLDLQTAVNSLFNTLAGVG